MRGVVEPRVPTARAIRSADPAALRERLARSVDVDAARVFLTHGATEANGWVTTFVARQRRAPRRCRLHYPEYPPLAAIAAWAGLRPTDRDGPAAFGVLSNPRNPEGRWMPPEEVAERMGGVRDLLVDETFREFARVPTYAGDGSCRVWRTGTFTKFFGGDGIRVGFVVAPEEACEAFAQFHAHFVDRVPEYSLAAAIATWDARDRFRRAVARVFDRNVARLRAALPDAPPLAAPVYFDRVPGVPGRALAERGLRRSVLVCPGDLFGDPSGVRIGLTRPSFPVDFAAYLSVRDRAGSRHGS